MVTAVVERDQLTHAEIRSALFDASSPFHPKEQAVNAFLEVRYLGDPANPSERRVIARELFDALEKIDALNLTEQLGFLVLVRSRLITNISDFEAASAVSAETSSDRGGRHLS